MGNITYDVEILRPYLCIRNNKEFIFFKIVSRSVFMIPSADFGLPVVF